MPGTLFVYASRSFKGVSIDDQADRIKADLGAQEISLIRQWLMSHEKTGEMMTLRNKHQLPFGKFPFYKSDDGVAPWRHLSRCDQTAPHPFVDDEQFDGVWRLGRPNLFFIVDDEQLMRPVDDRGMRLLREQVSSWEYVPVKVTDSGQTAQKPSKINDDHCFVAGTMVTTRRGNLPIEDVIKGDWVWTRKGWQEVECAGYTGKRDVLMMTTSDGRQLCGTGNHPIWTENGWTPLEQIERHAILTTCQITKSNRHQNALSLTELPSTVTRLQNNDRIGCITHPMLRTANEGSAIITWNYGNRCMAIFRMGIISIIKTAIRSTMQSTIWNVCRMKNIHATMRRKHHQNCKRFVAPIWQKVALKLPHGTAVPLGKRGIFNTLKTLALGNMRPSGQRAYSAQKTLKANIIHLGSVRQSAVNDIGTNDGIPWWKNIVRTAVSCLRRATRYADTALIRVHLKRDNGNGSTMEYVSNADSHWSVKRDVPVSVIDVVSAGQADVYNLQVKNVPEFYANGILVHNCDCLKSCLALFGPKATVLTETEVKQRAMAETFRDVPIVDNKANVLMGQQLWSLKYDQKRKEKKRDPMKFR